jgi:hemerythrin HHE cation binding domain-containing protein
MTVIYEGTTRSTSMILHHHAVLRRGLEQRVGALCQAADDREPFEKPRADLLAYLEAEILPHAKAEEDTLYRAATTQARGGDLVHTLTGEHCATTVSTAGSSWLRRRRSSPTSARRCPRTTCAARAAARRSSSASPAGIPPTPSNCCSTRLSPRSTAATRR